MAGTNIVTLLIHPGPQFPLVFWETTKHQQFPQKHPSRYEMELQLLSRAKQTDSRLVVTPCCQLENVWFWGDYTCGLLLFSGEFPCGFNESCRSRREEENLCHGSVSSRTGHHSDAPWDTLERLRPWLWSHLCDRDWRKQPLLPVPAPGTPLSSSQMR